MAIALRRQLRQPLPQVSFGPFRFLEALPWLVLAAAMRVIAFGGGPVAFPAIVIASIAVLHAFLVVAQRSIELGAKHPRLKLTTAQVAQVLRRGHSRQPHGEERILRVSNHGVAFGARCHPSRRGENAAPQDEV
jgi:hypothetical protein